MSNPPVTLNVSGPSTLKRQRPGRPPRYFYLSAAFIMVVVMVAGFHPFYVRGEGMAGRKISPELLPLVVIHGTAMTAWVIVFLIQSILIPTRKVRVHMKLGWVGVAVALIVSLSGFMVAVRSVRPIPTLPFWGMQYRQFLMVMLAEVIVFSLFVAFGVLLRKKPKIHRAMMLLATISILAGATVRMPVLFPIFGAGGWLGIFGPIFTLAGIFLIAQLLTGKLFDRWFAVGYVAMIVFYISACKFAVTDGWSYLAKAILGA